MGKGNGKSDIDASAVDASAVGAAESLATMQGPLITSTRGTKSVMVVSSSGLQKKYPLLDLL